MFKIKKCIKDVKDYAEKNYSESKAKKKLFKNLMKLKKL